MIWNKKTKLNVIFFSHSIIKASTHLGKVKKKRGKRKKNNILIFSDTSSHFGRLGDQADLGNIHVMLISKQKKHSKQSKKTDQLYS